MTPMRATPPTEVLHAIELLLAATFKTRQDGRRESFLLESPAPLSWMHRISVELFHTKLGLLEAARHVRSCGPTYLRCLSIHELESKLVNFLTRNYWLLADETLSPLFESSFATQVSTETKVRLANVLATSEIFIPRYAVTLFPLIPIHVADNFDSEPFFFIQPTGLTSGRIGSATQETFLVPEQFPPLRDWNGICEKPNAWLGVRSPTLSGSKKLRNAILGAVALLPHPRERYLFSDRKMFGGHVTIDERWSISLGEAHTPPLSENLVISTNDHEWLAILAAKLQSTEEEARRHIKALEYYHRAWSLNEVERFPVLFMALDAIFGDASQATQAAVDAVGPVMGSTYDNTRLKLLLSLRASVIHGGAPDVYDSDKYFKYYRKYVQDPIYDLELISVRCLQSAIFQGSLVSRPHTYADLLKREFGIEE